MDNVIKNKHSGLTELETYKRNMESEIQYRIQTGDQPMADRLQAEMDLALLKEAARQTPTENDE